MKILAIQLLDCEFELGKTAPANTEIIENILPVVEDGEFIGYEVELASKDIFIPSAQVQWVEKEKSNILT
jgi:hypothetical protein